MTNTTISDGPVLPEAFLSYDCRPLYRWVACGQNYQFSLRIFYSVYFCIHAISTLVALTYTIRTFVTCRVCGKNAEIQRRNRKMSLRVFTIFSLVAFSSCALYCYFLIDPLAYGLPPWLSAFLWALACNSLGSAAAMLVFTWADALDENHMAVSSKFLTSYRKPFFVVLFDRAISTLILTFSGADIGGRSYLPLIRLYCAHWSAFAIFLTASMLYYGSKMRSRLLLLGAPKAVMRTTRVLVLYVGTSSSCAIFAGIQSGIQEIMENSSTAWLVMLSLFHAIITILATWFIIGRPSQNDLQRNTKSGTMTVSKGASKVVSADFSSR